MGAGGDRMALLNAAPPGLLLSCRCWCAAQLAGRTKGGGLEASARFFLRGGQPPGIRRPHLAHSWPSYDAHQPRGGVANRHDSQRTRPLQ